MALSKKIGSFVCPGSTGNKSVTGVGFEPQLVIFFTVGATGGNTVHQSNIGCMDYNGNQWSVGVVDGNAKATTDCERGFYNSRCLLNLQLGGIRNRAYYVSMDSDGFTVNFDYVNSNDTFYYIALAGFDDVNVGIITNRTTSGSQAITGVGFEPDALVLSTAICEVGANKAYLHLGNGFADSSLNQQCSHFRSADNVSTSVCETYYSQSKIIYVLPAAGGTPEAEAEVDSFDSDGFTLDWTYALTSDRKSGFIAFKGVDSFVGNTTAKITTTGTKAVTGVGFQPEVLMLLGGGTSTGLNSDGITNIGFAYGASANEQVVNSGYSEDAVGTSDTDRYTAMDYSYCYYDGTVQSRADLDSLDSDGFTLDFDTVDANARYIPFLALTGELIPSNPNMYFMDYEVEFSEGFFQLTNIQSDTYFKDSTDTAFVDSDNNWVEAEYTVYFEDSTDTEWEYSFLKETPTSWLGTWAKRIKITVDNTNIDSDLSYFPVPIVLGTSVGQSSQDLSGVFDELTSDANRFKIAITKSDGTTQIYGDIELWDDANEKAVIHVAKSDLDITTASTTTLYIYYDSAQSDNTDYIGDTGGTAAQSVWDSNFEAVYHMAQDPSGTAPQILDSTSKGHNGTSVGSMVSGDLVDAGIGKGIEFNGTQAIGLSTSFNDILSGSSAKVTFVISFETSVSTGGVLFGKYDSASDNRGILVRALNETFQRLSLHYEDKLVGDRREGAGNTTISTSTEYTIIATYDATQGSGNDGMDRITLTVNNASQSLTSFYDSGSVVDLEVVAAHAALGAILDTSGANPSLGFTGIISEVSVSDNIRSAAWMKATYYALTDDLLTYGAEEEYSGTEAGAEITLDSGTLAFTGTDVDLIPDRNIILGSGTLGLTGTDIALSKSKSTITLNSGTLSLTGTDVGLSKSKYTIPLDSGTLALTGTDVNLTKLGSEILLDSGTLTLTGTDVDLVADRNIILSSGTLALAGTGVDLVADRNIILSSGTLALAGTDTTLTKTSRNIVLDSGTLTLTGTDITLSAAGKITLDSGTLGFTGTDVTLSANRVVDLDSGTLSFNGSYIDLQLTTHGTLDGELPEISCECDLIERSGLLDSEFPQLSVEANTGIRSSNDLPSITAEAFGTGGEVGSVSAKLPELKVEIRTSHGVLAKNFPELLAEAVATTPVLCDLSRSLPWISSEGLMAGSIGYLDKILGVLEITASALAENTGNLNSPLPGLKGRITALAGSMGTMSSTLPELQSEAAIYSVIISLSSYLPVITPGVVSGGSSGLTDNTMTNEDRFDDTLLRYQRWA